MVIPNVAIRKILYTTDLSENARFAFAYAASMAGQYNAGITMLHVISEDPDLDARVVGYISSEKWEQIKERNTQEAKDILIGKATGRRVIGEVLTQFCEDAMGSLTECSFRTDDILVVRGNPVEKIVSAAEETGCDLVVMGSRGVGSLADAMLGSTAQRVIRRSSKPVLVIRLPEEA
jgi:nucleotide-binding universal stress UspA family protein